MRLPPMNDVMPRLERDRDFDLFIFNISRGFHVPFSKRYVEKKGSFLLVMDSSPKNNSQSHIFQVLQHGFEFARNLTEETVKYVRPVVIPFINPLIEPIISVRPKEVISDTIDYTVPFTSHTVACINYIKRRIRISVFN